MITQQEVMELEPLDEALCAAAAAGDLPRLRELVEGPEMPRWLQFTGRSPPVASAPGAYMLGSKKLQPSCRIAAPALGYMCIVPGIICSPFSA